MCFRLAVKEGKMENGAQRGHRRVVYLSPSMYLTASDRFVCCAFLQITPRRSPACQWR